MTRTRMLGSAAHTSLSAGRPRRIPLREKAFAVALAGAALLIMAKLAIQPGNWGDWQSEAKPAVDALVAGHVGRFLALAPVYGGSLILRAPFILATTLWHGGENAYYRASAVPCLAAAGILGLWLSARQRARGASRIACLVTLLLCVANPLIFPALRVGHPEEILGAVLCAAAVVCALDDRPLWAGILLGLAVANKEWAVLAAGPLLLALPRARVRAVIASGVTAVAVMAPLLLATSGGFANTTSAVGTNTGHIFMPWQWWWFFGSHFHPAAKLHYDLAHLYRKSPAWLGGLGHILPVALMPPLTALYAWRRRDARQRRHDVLLLLTLVFALRCVLDPWDISYYALPFVFALTAWDSLDSPRVPYVALMGTLTTWFILVRTGNTGLFLSSDVQALVFMLVTVPAIPAIALRVFAPEVARRLVPRPRAAVAAADPVPTTA